MNAPDLALQQNIQPQEIVTGRDPAAPPVASIIVLHGLGTTGSDFVPLLRSMNFAAVGPVRCVFPDAPLRTMSFNDTDMPAWYDAAPSGASRHAALPADEAGLRASQSLVQALIDREEAQGVPSERIVLLGFSQGAVLALHTGLRAPQRLAAIVALSGYLPLGARTLQTESNTINQRLPIFLGHGEHDEVVVMDRARAARTALQVMGHLVDWHTYSMGHEVSDTELADVSNWLTGVLSVV